MTPIQWLKLAGVLVVFFSLLGWCGWSLRKSANKMEVDLDEWCKRAEAVPSDAANLLEFRAEFVAWAKKNLFGHYFIGRAKALVGLIDGRLLEIKNAKQ